MKFPALAIRLRQALTEDGAYADVTTRPLSAFHDKSTQARVMAKQDGVWCGAFLIRSVFSLLDRGARVRSVRPDGAPVKAGQTLAVIQAKTGALLSGERVFLNLATHLSGIATLTRKFTDAVKPAATAVLDTRKTTPLWRDLEKFAVLCGGGKNHRFSLSDAVLVKDNHLKILHNLRRSVPDVYGRARFDEKRAGLKFVEMEATTYADVWDAIKSRVDIILLDNMPMNRLKGSIAFIRSARSATMSDRPLIEISGGVNLESARVFAGLGVDRISVGALTHSAPALDLSLEVD